MQGDFTTGEPLGVDAWEFSRLFEGLEYEVTGLMVMGLGEGTPVIMYDEDDEPVHGDGPCGEAGCPCMA
jgi:hypothetical protein